MTHRPSVIGAAVCTIISGALAPHAMAADVTHVSTLREGLSAPTSIHVSDDGLAVLEPYAQRVVLYTADGRETARVDITGDAMGLTRLTNLVYLYCDRQGGRVIAIDVARDEQSTFLQVSEPDVDLIDVTVDGTTCYVLDAGRGMILVTDAAGTITRHLDLTSDPGATSHFPSSLAWDPGRRVFHVLDQLASEITTYAASGERLHTFGSFGTEDGAISRGGEVACDGEGYLYVSDRFQGRVAVFDPDGAFLINVDPTVHGGGRLAVPTGMDVDGQGLLYTASTEGRAIHVFHVDRSGLPEAGAAALPIYPADLDTVGVQGLRLVARVELPPASPSVSGVDFQILPGADTTQVVAETSDQPLTTDPWSGEGIPLVGAEWLVDTTLDVNVLYAWRTRARGANWVGAWSDLSWFLTAMVPAAARLDQNYPNPFNPRTTIAFAVPQTTAATVTIHDIQGRVVWHQHFDRLPPGRHLVTWDGTSDSGTPLGSGLYFYRLVTAGFRQTRKMALLR